MCTEPHSTYTWVLSFTLVIGLLIVCGISYFNMKPTATCGWSYATNNSVHEFKQIYGDKLYDEIGKKNIKSLRRIYPKMIDFWKSVYPDLPVDDEHAKVLRDILEKWQDNFERIRQEPLSKNQRIQLFNTYKRLQKKLGDLSLLHTEKMLSCQFMAVCYEHKYMEYSEFSQSEEFIFLKDVRDSWKDMYACIPKEYLKIYPDFVEINKEFEDAKETSETDSILSLWSHLDEFFQNELSIIY